MKKLYLAYLKYNRDWYFMHSLSGEKANKVAYLIKIVYYS
jgi:hypothetical protein